MIQRFIKQEAILFPRSASTKSKVKLRLFDKKKPYDVTDISMLKSHRYKRENALEATGVSPSPEKKLTWRR